MKSSERENSSVALTAVDLLAAAAGVHRGAERERRLLEACQRRERSWQAEARTHGGAEPGSERAADNAARSSPRQRRKYSKQAGQWYTPNAGLELKIQCELQVPTESRFYL